MAPGCARQKVTGLQDLLSCSPVFIIVFDILGVTSIFSAKSKKPVPGKWQMVWIVTFVLS